MRKSFWGSIWSNFLRIQGVLLAFITLVLAFILWLFPPNISVPLVFVIPIVLAFVVLTITLGSTAHEIFLKNKYGLPNVIFGKKPFIKTEGQYALCLLEPSELFSYGASVSFYYIDEEGFELLIGIGKVVNIQEDGKIQVVMLKQIQGQEEIVDGLAQNNAQILKKTKVKPIIPSAYLSEMLENPK